MNKEAPFDIYVNNLLKEAGIEADYQGSSKKEIQEALSTASKSQTGSAGAPDFTAVVKDFVLVIEDKADKNKLCLKDDEGGISLDVNATENYAINGALFYAKKILEGSSFTKIFAFGCAGDPKHHVLKPVFVSNDEIIELSEIETFENFSPENIEDYYRKAVLKEESPEEIESENIGKIAATLHDDLRNYGNLGAHENPLAVSAILLALSEQKYSFKLEQLTGDEEVESDGEKLYKALEASLKRAKVFPEVKKDRVLDQFAFIKNMPRLNKVHEKLAKTPLKYFAEFINRHVYSKLDIENSAEDYLGRFYTEFIRYTGGDGQSLGIVITPKHITELFCDLVDLKPDDVIFDPCCGTGGFLIAGMHRMLRAAKNESEKTHIRKKQIFGIELRSDMFSMATTGMILHGDGQSNLICEDFFRTEPSDWQLKGITVGFMNPPYSQAKNKATENLSELSFIEHLLDSVTVGGKAVVIVPVSAMIGKTNDDKFRKAEILKHHTLEGVINLNKNTFYGVGTVPCIAIFTAGEPHQPEKISKFINFEDDGWEVQKHRGLVETERAKDRKQYLLDCWRGNVKDCPSRFMIETHAEASDEWLHSFYYFNDEIPTEQDFKNSIADYLTFEFNMIAHGRGYLFGEKQDEKKNSLINGNQWKLFTVGDLFYSKIGKAIDGNKVDKTTGNFAYITRKGINNGLDGFISYDKSYLNEHFPVITIGNETAEPFVQAFPFFTGTKVNILSPKVQMSQATMLFIVQSLKNHKEKYSYAFTVNSMRLKRQIIQLPVEKSGQPNYKFMEDYVKQHEQKMLQDYFDFIVPRLKDKTDKINFDGHEWKSFTVRDLFSVTLPSGDIQADKCEDGDIPLLSAGFNNNGICKFIKEGNSKSKVYGKNVISVDMFGQTFFHGYEFCSVSHGRVNLLSPIGNMSQYHLKFMITVLNNSVQGKFSYNQMCSSKRIQEQIILLPVDDSGQPDYKFMEDYIKNLEHEILKEFVSLKSN